MTVHGNIEPNSYIPRYRFRNDDGLIWRTKTFRPISVDDHGHTLLCLELAIHETFSHEQIHAMFHERLSPLEHRKGLFSENGAKRTTYSHEGFLGNLNERDQAVSCYRADWCREFLKLEVAGKTTRSDKSMLGVIATIASTIDHGKYYKTKKGSPSPRTLRNWVRRFERDDDPLALVDSYGGSRQNTYFTADEEEILQKWARAYASEDEPLMIDLWDLMKAEIEELNKGVDLKSKSFIRTPSLKTLQNRINALPPAFIDRGRLGENAATNKWSAIREGMEILRPMQRLEMDEWKVDLKILLTVMGLWRRMTKKQKEAVPQIRVWITAAICVATKCMVALRVHKQAPSTLTALAALEMTTIDKTSIAKHYGCEEGWPYCGSAEKVGVDSATWYTNLAFRVTVNDLGATLFLPPAGAASCRGTIESFFRMSSMKAVRFFSGRIWGNVEDRNDDRTDLIASITFDEIAALLTRFYVDIYHLTDHGGLGGEAPKDAWHRLGRQFKIVPPPTGERRRHIFGINVRRVLGKHGVRFMGINYQSSALQSLRRNKRKAEIQVRVDRQDLGKISVWTGEGWLAVPAVDEEFQGMSIWVWTVLSETLRKNNVDRARVNRGTVRRAKKAIRSKAQIARLEAGIDTPIVTGDEFAYWEKRLDMRLDITDAKVDHDDFDDFASLPEAFLDTFGIDMTDEEQRVAAEQSWKDPQENPPSDIEDKVGHEDDANDANIDVDTAANASASDEPAATRRRRRDRSGVASKHDQEG